LEAWSVGVVGSGFREEAVEHVGCDALVGGVAVQGGDGRQLLVVEIESGVGATGAGIGCGAVHEIDGHE